MGEVFTCECVCYYNITGMARSCFVLLGVSELLYMGGCVLCCMLLCFLWFYSQLDGIISLLALLDLCS